MLQAQCKSSVQAHLQDGVGPVGADDGENLGSLTGLGPQSLRVRSQ